MLNKKLIFPFALVFHETMVYLSTDMYLPALPKMQQEFALITQESQAALSMWFLGAGCCQWLIGPLSDRFGRRPTLLLSIIIYIASCIFCANTNNYNLFLIGRFIQGSMIGPIFVGGYAAIHEKFLVNDAIRILAIMGCVTIFAPTMGPMFGALILDYSDWQHIFLVLAVLSGIAGIVLFFSMPETLMQKTRINLIEIANSYWQILKAKKFLLPTMANCCTFAAMIAWLTMSAFISHAKGFSSKEYGIMQLCVFGFYIIGNRAISPLLDKYRKETIIKFGLMISSVGGLLSFIIYLLFPSLLLCLASITIITLGAGMCGPNLQKLAMENSEESMALKLSVYSTMISLNGALISMAVSFLPISWPALITAMMICILIALTLGVIYDYD